MISEQDLQFHIPENIPHDWAETGYFNIYVPERNLFCWIYYVHRAGVGATVTDVEVIDRWSDTINDALYIDYTNHNPLPASATDFTLPCGLSFVARSLQEYHIQYQTDALSLDLAVTGIMPPYDIHDKSMDPLATDDSAKAIANSGFGSAYASHFDMSVRITGTLTLGGQQHKVDCIATMDHSWGPRPENAFTAMNWSNAHFGQDYVLHTIFAYDRQAKKGCQHQLKHGYALIDGKVRGAKAGAANVVRNGDFATAVEIELIDVDDRVHRLFGSVVAHTPWRLYGNANSTMAMVEWRRPGSTDVAYGTYFDTWPLNRLRNTL